VDPVPDPLLIFFPGSVGNRTWASGSVAKNSDHRGGLTKAKYMQKSFVIMRIKIYGILDKAKPSTTNIRGLNLSAVKCTTVQVSRLSWQREPLVTRA
jgi:hypothetical protein